VNNSYIKCTTSPASYVTVRVGSFIFYCEQLFIKCATHLFEPEKVFYLRIKYITDVHIIFSGRQVQTNIHLYNIVETIQAFTLHK